MKLTPLWLRSLLVVIFLAAGLPALDATAATAAPTDCPSTLHCVYVPAAYRQNSPDPTDYGNYDVANRPAGPTIDGIVVHITEGDLASVIQLFQDSTSIASAHDVIGRDGTVYVMVPAQDIAYHADNYDYNTRKIGYEIVGHSALGDVTRAQYRSVALLAQFDAARFHFPLDRQHIIGHDNVPAPRDALASGMHVDTGPFFDWQLLMILLGAPVMPNAGPDSQFVTIAPLWPLSRQTVTGCWPTPDLCAPGGSRPTNFVYLHTAASQSAPLLSDPLLGQGTTDVGNNAAKAYYGQQFVVSDRQSDTQGTWYQVWYDGQRGWFYSPRWAPTAVPTKGHRVTPKAGLSTVPVYGQALPESSDYAAAPCVPPAGAMPVPTPLSYTVLAGQQYSLAGQVTAERYRAVNFDGSALCDRTLYTGTQQYDVIQFNGRQYYVRASDVDVS